MSGPGSFEQRTYLALLSRKAQLEEEVFTHPPADWAEFQRRAGQWVENNRLLTDFRKLVEGIEDGEKT